MLITTRIGRAGRSAEPPGRRLDAWSNGEGPHTGGPSTTDERGLLDAEDLGVLRERPQIVGDDPLEPVGDLADGVHGRDDRALDVLGAVEAVVVLGVVLVEVDVLEGEDRVDELVDEAGGLADQL